MSRPSRRALAALVLAAMTVTAGCAAVDGSDATPADTADIGFERVPDAAGLDYVDDGEGGAGNGDAGVYVADYDRDGWPDVLASGGEGPALFHNAGGEFERSGALPPVDRSIKSAAWVDFDGDGWPDLLLLPRDGAPVALENREGTFARVDVGLGNVSHPLGAAAADYDGDGDDDLFVYQSGDWTERKPAGYFSLDKQVVDDNGYPNRLYENVDGTYRRVDDAGIDGDRWSLAASFVDLTGDGRPDIHVANDYNNDTLYVNEGDGTFDQRHLGGATARNGMSSEVADVTGDARPDVFVTNIHIPITRGTVGRERYERLKHLFRFVIKSERTKGNTLLVNEFGEGAGTAGGAGGASAGLVDRADEYGVRDGGWGWAATAADLDNDGDRDLLHATQNVVRLDRDDPVYTYPMVFERGGDGFDRLDADARGFAEDDGRGVVAVDYDRDGDLDVISANYLSEFTVYENTAVGSAPDANALTVRVAAADGTTDLGATVEVDAGDASTTLHGSSRTDFLSQEPRASHVGLAAHESATLHVTWSDGTERTFEDVAAGRVVRVMPDGVETVLTYRDPDGASDGTDD
ncbi:CRTAC1 family protein [Halobaculum lipolyticum]|uniref:CRTAC1 family protein n=1 Tax=Halobaculum lipolyticum TaxID=3032001 RepID=A0ABD5W5Z1_9EURY|nr:CRTAC1 family protein [Halobaculum sp. DT31]